MLSYIKQKVIVLRQKLFGQTTSSEEGDDENPPKLDQWFTNPILLLEERRTEDSDGAFLALSACCALYERFLIKLAQDKGVDYEDKRNELGGVDMGITPKQFQMFWGCFRDGLQHQFQPTKKRNGITYDWRISKKTPSGPESH